MSFNVYGVAHQKSAVTLRTLEDKVVMFSFVEGGASGKGHSYEIRKYHIVTLIYEERKRNSNGQFRSV